jgi:hypothetical protein
MFVHSQLCSSTMSSPQNTAAGLARYEIVLLQALSATDHVSGSPSDESSHTRLPSAEEIPGFSQELTALPPGDCVSVLSIASPC